MQSRRIQGQKATLQGDLVDMRDYFEEQLEELHIRLTEMGSLCVKSIEETYEALMSGDRAAAEKIMRRNGAIKQREREIENLSMKLLLLQQPVATDLRVVSAAMKMSTDMERIGNQAAEIAEILLTGDVEIPESKIHIRDMAQATMDMVNRSIDSFVKQDRKLAEQVIQYDDTVDELFLTVRKDLSTGIGSEVRLMDLLMIAKYYERIGDHAVNIAEWVIYSVTGEHPAEEEQK